MIPCPKIQPVRSRHYLAWIRTKPCAYCGRRYGIQAAHQGLGEGIMGGKVSDLRCVPLCHDCHRAEHAQGHDTFWQGYDLATKIVRYHDAFFGAGNRL